MSRISRTIFVRNLPYTCTSEKLEDVFSAYGPVKTCFLVKDKVTGKSRGIGYVTYTLRDDAIKTKDEKVSIEGRRLYLDFADIGKKVKTRKKKDKDLDDTAEEKESESEDEDEAAEKPQTDVIGSNKKGKSEQEKMSLLKYHRAKIVLLSGLGKGLTEEKLNSCLQKLNVKHVAEVKVVTGDSAHVKFKCIRDAKRAINRLHDHEYNGSALKAQQLSRDAPVSASHKLIKRSRLIVRNLAWKCNEKDLEKHFKKFGELTDVKLLKNEDGQSLGVGFVQYTSLPDAKKAIDGMNSTKIAGRAVAVDWALPKDKYEAVKADKKHAADESDEDEDNEGSFSGEGSSDDEKTGGKRKRDASDDDSFSGEEEEEEEDDDDGDDDDEDDDDDDEEEEVDKKDVSEGSEDEDSSDEEEEEAADEEEEEEMEEERIDVDEGKTVFIRNLSYDTEEDKLGEFFEKYGEIHYAKVVIDFNTEHSRGMAFVKYKSKESADKCLAAVNPEDLTLDGRLLSVTLAVSRMKSAEFNEKKKKEKKDNRNLYLAREGYVRPGTQAAVGLTDLDLKKRAQVEVVKRQKLKDINIFVSTVRLCVRNIPMTVTEQQLKSVYLKAAQNNAAQIDECRIMRDQKRVNASGVGKSLGYGFVKFTEHQDALNALRQTNNNPDTFGEKKRLIVEFSLENRRALEVQEKRKNRQILKKEILKKNVDTGPQFKRPRIDKEKLKAVQRPNLSSIKLSEQDKKTKAKLPKGMPTHMGPKIRHKARQSQQTFKNKKSNNKQFQQPRQNNRPFQQSGQNNRSFQQSGQDNKSFQQSRQNNRQFQQSGQNNRSFQQPRQNFNEGPARKKQRTGKKNQSDQFDSLVAKYKNNLLGQKKSKWYS